jgi:hypothetical protein
VLQRILLVVLILFVVWRVLALFGRRSAREGHGADSYSRYSPTARRRRREYRTRESEEPPEELVACARCGTHLPARRALSDGSGARFCGPSCRDRAEVS